MCQILAIWLQRLNSYQQCFNRGIRLVFTYVLSNKWMVKETKTISSRNRSFRYPIKYKYKIYLLIEYISIERKKISGKHVVFLGYFRRRNFNVICMKHDVMIETEQAAFSLTWQNAGGSYCLRYKDIQSALGPTLPHRFLFSKYLTHICNILVIIFVLSHNC